METVAPNFSPTNTSALQLSESSENSVIIAVTATVVCVLFIVVFSVAYLILKKKRRLVITSISNPPVRDWFTRPRSPVLFQNEMISEPFSSSPASFWHRPLQPVTIDKDLYPVTRYWFPCFNLVQGPNYPSSFISTNTCDKIHASCSFLSKFGYNLTAGAPFREWPTKSLCFLDNSVTTFAFHRSRRLRPGFATDVDLKSNIGILAGGGDRFFSVEEVNTT